MPEVPWDELIALTARLEKLCDDRCIARQIGNEQLKNQCQAQINDVLKRRQRLMDRISNCHATA